MDKVKKFIFKYKLVISVALFLLVSFFVYLFVFANEDIYANQIEVKNTSVSIIDGTPNTNGDFDPTEGAGNDTSDNNHVVRNFDQITYNISYELGYKADSTLDPSNQSTDVTRDVIIDIIVPKSIYMQVSNGSVADTLTPELTITNGNNEYKYYSVEIKNAIMTGQNSAEIILSNISGQNGQTISPIIRVRESTDEVSDKTITTSTNVSNLNKINLSSVTISATPKYGVKLYQGVIEKDKENSVSQMPIGIAIYIPSDELKGIKGVEIPSTVNFNLKMTSNVGTEGSSVIGSPLPTFDNNPSSSGHVVADLPNSYTTGNGRASVSNATKLNDNKETIFPITFADLEFNENTALISSSENLYYLSTKIFTFQNQRTSGYKNDIKYNVTTDAAKTNSLSDYLDNYEPFVGDYVSKIDFTSSFESYDSQIDFVDSGRGIYNYNEDFYIQNTISYGMQKGDTLENGFTNYVKVDNTAFQLLNVGNASDESLDYYVQFGTNGSGNHISNAHFGIGEWDLTYFDVRENAPSYCPSTASLNSMTPDALREKLMNLFGGPCITANSNLSWVESLPEEDSPDINKVIMFKLDVIDEYETGEQTIIRLKAKALKKYENIGKTYAILARAETNAYNDIYYLSPLAEPDIPATMTEDMRYEKTVYTSNEVTGGNITYINGTALSENKNAGNTVLISPFKAKINPINTYDAYGSNKSSFYSGMTDPIEIEINPVIYKSDFDATITGATVSVYLPAELEIYEKTGDKKYDRSTSGGIEIIDGVQYKKYDYKYSESDINFENQSVSGTIPILHVHAYISIATQDRTNIKVLSRISGTLKSNADAVTVYTDISPLSERTTSTNLLLRNTRKVNNIGKVNTVRIDKNQSYSYNMRAVNNSGEATKLSLINLLPYSGDGVGDGSDFEGSIKVSLAAALPTGYTAYYTNDNSKSILNNELSSSNANNWTAWSSVTTPVSATAIKIVSSNQIANLGYFGSDDGITLNITTQGNKEADKYFNNFYMIQENAEVCVDTDMSDDCSRTERKNVSYVSNISEVSVYNRIISGYAFEDSNYNGFYNSETEPRLKDIPADLYKLSATDFDLKNPVDAIGGNDELVDEGLTDRNGYYSFSGLPSGNYYVKYTINCDKYTTTEKNKTDITNIGDASLVDSDAQMIENYINTEDDSDDQADEETEEDSEVSEEENTEEPRVCYAVSNILTLNNDTVEQKHIDLGLRVRQDFDIKIRKYITNVTVTSNKGVKSYDYNKESKVQISIKNLKNTSFKVTYGIEIENNKYFPGTIGNIVETIPEGMTFNPNLIENDGWYESDGNLYYSYLNKTLIMPGEKYHLKIVLNLDTDSGGDYINFVAANNLQIKPVITNFLEIPEETELIPDEDWYDEDWYDDEDDNDDDWNEDEGE